MISRCQVISFMLTRRNVLRAKNAEYDDVQSVTEKSSHFLWDFLTISPKFYVKFYAKN